MHKFRKKLVIWNVLWLIGMAVGGCQTVSSGRSALETRRGIQAVGGAMAGRPLSREEARRFQQQIKNDPEAQTAIRKIADAMREHPKAKYCPVGGEHYAPHLEICPVHKVKLKIIGED